MDCSLWKRVWTCRKTDFWINEWMNYYLLQLSCHSVAVVLTLVQSKQIGINIHKRNNKKHSTNNTKHSKYRSHITKTPTHYKTHTYTHPHITKPTLTHTHTLQNPHLHTPTHYKTHTYTHLHITKLTHYQNTHTLQNPHKHTRTHTLQHPTYTQPHITKHVITTTVPEYCLPCYRLGLPAYSNSEFSSSTLRLPVLMPILHKASYIHK